MRYSVQSKDRKFVKGYRFLFFPKNMGKYIGKNINRNLSGKCTQKCLIMLNNLLQMHLKLLQKK